MTARHTPHGPQGLVATGVGAATGTSAYGFLYARHQLRVTRADDRCVGPSRRSRRSADRPAHRRPPQPLGVARRRPARRGDAHGRTAGSDRPRRRLRDVGRPAVRRPVRRGARAAVGAATVSSPSSAIMTTTTRCRRRSTKNGVQVLKDARTHLDDQRRRRRPRRHPLLDQTAGRHRGRRARRHRRRSSCWRTIRGA